MVTGASRSTRSACATHHSAEVSAVEGTDGCDDEALLLADPVRVLAQVGGHPQLVRPVVLVVGRARTAARARPPRAELPARPGRRDRRRTPLRRATGPPTTGARSARRRRSTPCAVSPCRRPRDRAARGRARRAGSRSRHHCGHDGPDRRAHLAISWRALVPPGQRHVLRRAARGGRGPGHPAARFPGRPLRRAGPVPRPCHRARRPAGQRPRAHHPAARLGATPARGEPSDARPDRGHNRRHDHQRARPAAARARHGRQPPGDQPGAVLRPRLRLRRSPR